MDDTGLDDASVDLVVSNNVLHELHDPAAAIAEWKRLLKLGRHMAISDFWATRLSRAITGRAHGEEATGPFDVEDLTSLLVRSGLEKVRVIPYHNKLLALGERPARKPG